MKYLVMILMLVAVSCGKTRGVLLEPVSAQEFKVVGPVCTGGVLTIDEYYRDQVVVNIYCGDLKISDELKFLTRDIEFESYQYTDGEQVMVITRTAFNELMRALRVRVVGEDSYFQLEENWYAKIPKA